MTEQPDFILTFNKFVVVALQSSSLLRHRVPSPIALSPIPAKFPPFNVSRRGQMLLWLLRKNLNVFTK